MRQQPQAHRFNPGYRSTSHRGAVFVSFVVRVDHADRARVPLKVAISCPISSSGRRHNSRRTKACATFDNRVDSTAPVVQRDAAGTPAAIEVRQRCLDVISSIDCEHDHGAPESDASTGSRSSRQRGRRERMHERPHRAC